MDSSSLSVQSVESLKSDSIACCLVFEPMKSQKDLIEICSKEKEPYTEAYSKEIYRDIADMESKKLNDFLRTLCIFCQEKALSSFCEFLASKELTLISKTEAIDSEVRDDEARNFLVKSEPKME